MNGEEFFRLLWLSMKARHPRLVKEMTTAEIELAGINVRKEKVPKTKDTKDGTDPETTIKRV